MQLVLHILLVIILVMITLSQGRIFDNMHGKKTTQSLEKNGSPHTRKSRQTELLTDPEIDILERKVKTLLLRTPLIIEKIKKLSTWDPQTFGQFINRVAQIERTIEVFEIPKLGEVDDFNKALQDGFTEVSNAEKQLDDIDEEVDKMEHPFFNRKLETGGRYYEKVEMFNKAVEEDTTLATLYEQLVSRVVEDSSLIEDGKVEEFSQSITKLHESRWDLKKLLNTITNDMDLLKTKVSFLALQQLLQRQKELYSSYRMIESSFNAAGGTTTVVPQWTEFVTDEREYSKPTVSHNDTVNNASDNLLYQEAVVQSQESSTELITIKDILGIKKDLTRRTNTWLTKLFFINFNHNDLKWRSVKPILIGLENVLENSLLPKLSNMNITFDSIDASIYSLGEVEAALNNVNRVFTYINGQDITTQINDEDSFNMIHNAIIANMTDWANRLKQQIQSTLIEAVQFTINSRNTTAGINAVTTLNLLIYHMNYDILPVIEEHHKIKTFETNSTSSILISMRRALNDVEIHYHHVNENLARVLDESKHVPARRKRKVEEKKERLKLEVGLFLADINSTKLHIDQLDWEEDLKEHMHFVLSSLENQLLLILPYLDTLDFNKPIIDREISDVKKLLDEIEILYLHLTKAVFLSAEQSTSLLALLGEGGHNQDMKVMLKTYLTLLAAVYMKHIHTTKQFLNETTNWKPSSKIVLKDVLDLLEVRLHRDVMDKLDDIDLQIKDSVDNRTFEVIGKTLQDIAVVYHDANETVVAGNTDIQGGKQEGKVVTKSSLIEQANAYVVKIKIMANNTEESFIEPQEKLHIISILTRLEENIQKNIIQELHLTKDQNQGFLLDIKKSLDVVDSLCQHIHDVIKAYSLQAHNRQKDNQTDSNHSNKPNMTLTDSTLNDSLSNDSHKNDIKLNESKKIENAIAYKYKSFPKTGKMKQASGSFFSGDKNDKTSHKKKADLLKKAEEMDKTFLTKYKYMIIRKDKGSYVVKGGVNENLEFTGGIINIVQDHQQYVFNNLEPLHRNPQLLHKVSFSKLEILTGMEGELQSRLDELMVKYLGLKGSSAKSKLFHTDLINLPKEANHDYGKLLSSAQKHQPAIKVTNGQNKSDHEDAIVRYDVEQDELWIEVLVVVSPILVLIGIIIALIFSIWYVYHRTVKHRIPKMKETGKKNLVKLKRKLTRRKSGEDRRLLSSDSDESEENVLTDAEENVLTDSEGNILTDSEGNILTDAEGNILTDAEENILTDAEENVLTGAEGNILTDAEENVLTDAEGNILPDAEENVLTDEDENTHAEDENGTLLVPVIINEGNNLAVQRNSNKMDEESGLSDIYDSTENEM